MNIFGQNKILNHPERISSWLYGGGKTLITVHFDLTYACNHKCPQCSADEIMKNPVTMSLGSAKAYLLQLVNIGAKGIIFTGGEPTCHKNLLEILEYAKSLGLECGLVTNGGLIDGPYYASKLVEYCTWIRVSLDAGTPNMYAKTHGMSKGEFSRVVINIWELVNAKKKSKSKCTIGLGYLTDKNTIDIDEMMNFVFIAESCGVDYVQFRPFHNDKTPIDKILETIKQKFEKSKVNILYTSNKYEKFKDKNIRPYDKCYGINFLTIVCANGDVCVCCHWRGVPEYTIGNLEKTPLSKIWHNREEIFKNVDVKKCVPFCICDGFNRVLFDIKKEKTHPNFL